ncbi:hypothetical protein NDU88_001404 [Pleurodeles waltl]|uniref:Uncharacterized protein n=1 Tax=Pleurodeles waltl TaxID=8319 RepID=A0AAV7UWQ1_PLEWA|nr:hypothetical protein NDU88_001404 [Pleurodeles waltl]
MDLFLWEQRRECEYGLVWATPMTDTTAKLTDKRTPLFAPGLFQQGEDDGYYYTINTDCRSTLGVGSWGLIINVDVLAVGDARDEDTTDRPPICIEYLFDICCHEA